MRHVDIYTDGSARGNPGPGGFGVFLRYKDASGEVHEKEFSQGYELTTNNRMELLGAIEALSRLKMPCDVALYTDSSYVCNAFAKGWVCKWIANGWKTKQKKPVKNIDLWKRLLDAKKPHRVEFIWVRGHSGNPLNERCDALATSAADGSDLLRDEGYLADEGLNTG